MATKTDAVKFYKNAFRMIRNWKSSDVTKTEMERSFMQETMRGEVASLATIQDQTDRSEHLKKIQKWLDVSFHYKVPYPKPYYFPTGASPHQIKTRMNKATRI